MTKKETKNETMTELAEASKRNAATSEVATDTKPGTAVTSETMTTKGFLMELLKSIVIAAIIAGIILQFVKPTIVEGVSMENNFYQNDYLILYKQAYSFGKTPQQGDVVVLRSNLLDKNGKKKLLIKRVVGTSGDTISIQDGQVYINGDKDDMSYTKEDYTSGNIVDEKIEDGYVFCMGDNRQNSTDSRAESVGQVSEDQILGKVVLRLFPFNKIGFIDNPYEE